MTKKGTINVHKGHANIMYSSTFRLTNNYGFEGYTKLIANEATKSGSLNLERRDRKGTF